MKATLRSQWWKLQWASFQFCFSCGGGLKRQHVKAEGKRRHVCVKCEQITYVNPKVVAGVIPVMPDGRLVLLKRDIEPARGKWTFPAGYQEMGESAEEGAKRETWEEICTRVTIRQFLGVYSYADAGVVTLVYVGDVLKNQVPKAGQESQDVALFKPDALPWKQLAFRSSIDALRDYLKDH